MKKNILFGILTFVFMFIGISNVYAADPITLTQADFNEAKSNPGVDTAKGINYYEDEIAGGAYIPYYRLSRNGNFILDGEINLDNGEGIIQLRDNNVL